MRLTHFEAFAPSCPVCTRAGRRPQPLVLAGAAVRTADAVTAGTLHCPDCLHEYPVIDGIPVIVPDLGNLLAGRAQELLVRDDLDPDLEGILGDAIGPDTWFDVLRQALSTYGWDAWSDLDPAEPSPNQDAPVPGAARRCLGRLLELAGSEPGPTRRILDLGCAAGRTVFDLAAAHPGSIVLGVDLQLGLLRLAQRAAGGEVSYPRRRIGLVYERRRFPVTLHEAPRVDFWACDALALPFAPGVVDLCVALNLLDCVADPKQLLQMMAMAVAPGGRMLLATPYDWVTRATPVEAWLGGHSQRASHHGAGEAFLHALLADTGQPGTKPRESTQQPAGIKTAHFVNLGEDSSWPWQTRLHERSTVRYSSHLIALQRL